MHILKTALIIATCIVINLGMAAPSSALGPCEKEAARCNRLIDVEFRAEKKVAGDSEARNLMDGRRYGCRTAMKKCKRIATGRRDLRLGNGDAQNKGGYTTTNKYDTPTRY